MRVLDLFAGIGGFSIGLERAGMQTVGFVEKDEFCQGVLRKHWENIPIHGDITTRDFEPGEADVVTGGFPCQDISFAGKRAGITGERSGLYREMVRALRVVRPKYAIMENVAALLNNGMGTVCGELAANGYDAEWDCISASDVGAPHGRDRVWIASTDARSVKQSNGDGSAIGWWEWGACEIEATCNTNSLRKLEPPRLLGNIRRWIDNAISERAWWQDNWEEKFEALRGMDDGVPTRLDRSDVASGVKALGNAVVPQIPELIGRAILAAEQEQTNDPSSKVTPQPDNQGRQDSHP